MIETAISPTRPGARWHGLARPAMLLGVLLAVTSWWLSDRLPAPAALRPEAIVEPIEAAVDQPAFRTTVGGVEYSLQPRYTYEIAGVVASLHHSDAWWDLAHRDAHDHLNVADLCLVWGDNASSGTYLRMRFSNTQWTCTVEAKSRDDWNAFITTQMSNNHVLADKPWIARELLDIHVGEQVRIRGLLVDYAALEQGRIFSTRTTSHGHNGHNCEVLYVTSVEHLAPAPGAAWRTLRWVGWLLVAAGAVAWLLAPARALSERSLT